MTSPVYQPVHIRSLPMRNLSDLEEIAAKLMQMLI